jgi:hypothetical protein
MHVVAPAAIDLVDITAMVRAATTTADTDAKRSPRPTGRGTLRFPVKLFHSSKGIRNNSAALTQSNANCPQTLITLRSQV